MGLIRLVVGGRCSAVGTSGDSVVATLDRLVEVGLVASVGCSDGGASVGCVVRRAVVPCARSKGSTRSSGGSNLGVTETSGALVALPELHTGAAGVVVGRAGSEALLLLVVTREENLDGDGDEEENGGDDGNSEASLVEVAGGAVRGSVGPLPALAVTVEALLGVAGTSAERRVDNTAAAVCAVARQDSDGNHGTAAEDIEDQANEGEEGLAAQAAREDDGEDGVEDSGARQALDSLLPGRDVDIAVSEDREEVAVDSEDDGRAAELEGVEEGGREPEDSAADSHDVDYSEFVWFWMKQGGQGM
jgi:hypothetical protein